MRTSVLALAALGLCGGGSSFAQQGPAAPAPPVAQSAPAPPVMQPAPAPPVAQPAPVQAAPAVQPAPMAQPPAMSNWGSLPRMQLERQFAGPLQDTVIQRWRDPADGTVCYIYLPITAAHSTPLPSGYVEYGANAIGSISCIAPPPPPRSPAPEPVRRRKSED
jgi:hypothetical protein